MVFCVICRYIEIFRSSLAEIRAQTGPKIRPLMSEMVPRPSPYDRSDRFGGPNRLGNRAPPVNRGARGTVRTSCVEGHKRAHLTLLLLVIRFHRRWLGWWKQLGSWCAQKQRIQGTWRSTYGEGPYVSSICSQNEKLDVWQWQRNGRGARLGRRWRPKIHGAHAWIAISSNRTRYF